MFQFPLALSWVAPVTLQALVDDRADWERRYDDHRSAWHEHWSDTGDVDHDCDTCASFEMAEHRLLEEFEVRFA